MTGSGSGDSSDDPDRNDDGDRSIASDGRANRENTARDPDPGADSLESGPASARNPGRSIGERSNDGRARPSDERVTIAEDGIVRWFLKTNDGTVVVVRDLLTSVAIVAVIGLLLFGISGIWPPMVAVESGSMEPNMHRGDLIFVVDENRFSGDGAIDGTGVVPFEDGADSGHAKFGNPGDVIIFAPNGDDRQTPVIHRAHYWVEEGDDWVADADPTRLNGHTCGDIDSCPAPHDGFVTKGDANSGYDQVAGVGADTSVVRPEWVAGKGMFRIPWLGHIRLTFDDLLVTQPAMIGASVVPVAAGIVTAGGLLAGVGRSRR